MIEYYTPEAEAWTVSVNKFWPLLGIGDAQIIAANGPAAELYGYESPAGLIGHYASELAPEEDRATARQFWAMRESGIANTPVDYASRITRPDGEVVWHRRGFGAKLAGMDGETFVTRLELVGQPDPPAPPDLAAHGLAEADTDRICGRYTVQQVQHWLDDPTSDMAIPETFRIIVEKAGGLSRALSNKVGFSIETGKVSFLQACDRCLYVWWARKERERPQCPECRKEPIKDRSKGC